MSIANIMIKRAKSSNDPKSEFIPNLVIRGMSMLNGEGHLTKEQLVEYLDNLGRKFRASEEGTGLHQPEEYTFITHKVLNLMMLLNDAVSPIDAFALKAAMLDYYEESTSVNLTVTRRLRDHHAAMEYAREMSADLFYILHNSCMITINEATSKSMIALGRILTETFRSIYGGWSRSTEKSLSNAQEKYLPFLMMMYDLTDGGFPAVKDENEYYHSNDAVTEALTPVISLFESEFGLTKGQSTVFAELLFWSQYFGDLNDKIADEYDYIASGRRQKDIDTQAAEHKAKTKEAPVTKSKDTVGNLLNRVRALKAQKSEGVADGNSENVD